MSFATVIDAVFPLSGRTAQLGRSGYQGAWLAADEINEAGGVQGVAARATVRCAPDADGRYSYLFGTDGNAGPVRLRSELKLRGDARLEAVRP